jgi:hypothetical protein
MGQLISFIILVIDIVVIVDIVKSSKEHGEENPLDHRCCFPASARSNFILRDWKKINDKARFFSGPFTSLTISTTKLLFEHRVYFFSTRG